MSSWDAKKFERYRMLTDPLADKTIRIIIEQEGKEAINALFSKLRENDQLDDVEFPPAVEEYFQKTHQLPDWIDWDKVNLGEKVFAKYGPEISLCLLCKSLPEAYACAKGAKVLHSTGRMSEHSGSLSVFTRRLMETAQFVMNVCSPGGLSDSGNGIVTAQKVRLIHAAIRYYLRKYNWDLSNGEPINQQDMAGTLQSFSTLILEGLDQLNINLSEEEKGAYYHVWHVVGHIIGVHPELNPSNYKEGLALGKAILEDQMAASPEGVELTKAVYDFMEHTMPGNLFKHVPEAMIRFLAGDKIADVLEVRPYSRLQAVIIPRLMGHVFASESEARDLDHFTSKLVAEINQHLLQSMLLHFNDHKNVRFYIPPSLKGMWNLS
jgi:hypothetical protein